MCETAEPHRHTQAATGAHPHAPAHNGPPPLTVKILGVAMLLPEERKAVLVEGRKARLSTNTEEIIPPHYPVIAFEAGKYEARDVNDQRIPSDLGFNFAHSDHDAKAPRFEAYLLDRDTVSFRKIDASCPAEKVDDGNIPSMTELAGELELLPEVRKGSSKRVAGTVDLSKACAISGEKHGVRADHKITFGTSKAAPRAAMISATFNRFLAPPVIVLTNPDPAHNREITLLGNGPWTVLVANVPADEMMMLEEAPIKGPLQLTHVELLYDFYKLGKNQRRVIPFCDEDHRPSHTVNGHCGPPVKP